MLSRSQSRLREFATGKHIPFLVTWIILLIRLTLRLRLREEVDILKHLSQVASASGLGISHPNVLGYRDSWEEDETLFIQTELCALGNLSNFLWKYGRAYPKLNESRVWKIIAELSSVSAHLPLLFYRHV